VLHPKAPLAVPEELIPPDIQQFIHHNIDSVAQLEGLLLLRADTQVEWTAEEVAQRLYVPANEAAENLNLLVARELIAASGRAMLRYRYAPRSIDQQVLVDRLADLYAKYLVPVTHLIHAKPKSRIQEFSDAFRLRKE
jgi:predicted ArsR family transcriptional regulator